MTSIDQKSWSEVRFAMREALRQWIYDPNVTYIDYGWRVRRGTLLDREPPCIRIHVIEKLPKSALEAATQKRMTRGTIQKTIAGFPVDVPQGAFRLNQGWWGWGGGLRQPVNPRAGRITPMQGGISVSDAYRSIYGTLGGLVIDRESGDRMILSNFHVLAGYWHARPGWPIYQPARGDGGSRADTVARLCRHAMASNLDAAVAELTGSRQLINHQFDLAPVRGVGWAQAGMEVIKSGRTTGITRGRVTGVEGTAKMSYNGVYRLIHHVMNIEPRQGTDVSAGGDSGAFWLDEETMNVVGLHFASGKREEDGLAMDIQPILDALNVDIYS